MENPTQSFKEVNIVLSAYVKKSRKLKVKLWWAGAGEELILNVILSEGYFPTFLHYLNV